MNRAYILKYSAHSFYILYVFNIVKTCYGLHIIYYVYTLNYEAYRPSLLYFEYIFRIYVIFSIKSGLQVATDLVAYATILFLLATKTFQAVAIAATTTKLIQTEKSCHFIILLKLS